MQTEQRPAVLLTNVARPQKSDKISTWQSQSGGPPFPLVVLEDEVLFGLPGEEPVDAELYLFARAHLAVDDDLEE